MSRPVRRLLAGTMMLVALSMPPQSLAGWERTLPAVVYQETRRRRRPVRRFEGKWTLSM